MASVRVLLDIDDPALSGLLRARLAAEGVELAEGPDPDDVVLIGGVDGVSRCRQLRAAVPERRILVLAQPGASVAALEAGADDVVGREGLSLRELALRLRAVGRRSATVVA